MNNTDKMPETLGEAATTLSHALAYIMTSGNHDASMFFAESAPKTKSILWSAYYDVIDKATGRLAVNSYRRNKV